MAFAAHTPGQLHPQDVPETLDGSLKSIIDTGDRDTGCEGCRRLSDGETRLYSRDKQGTLMKVNLRCLACAATSMEQRIVGEAAAESEVPEKPSRHVNCADNKTSSFSVSANEQLKPSLGEDSRTYGDARQDSPPDLTTTSFQPPTIGGCSPPPSTPRNIPDFNTRQLRPLRMAGPYPCSDPVLSTEPLQQTIVGRSRMSNRAMPTTTSLSQPITESSRPLTAPRNVVKSNTRSPRPMQMTGAYPRMLNRQPRFEKRHHGGRSLNDAQVHTLDGRGFDGTQVHITTGASLSHLRHVTPVRDHDLTLAHGRSLTHDRAGMSSQPELQTSTSKTTPAFAPCVSTVKTNPDAKHCQLKKEEIVDEPHVSPSKASSTFCLRLATWARKSLAWGRSGGRSRDSRDLHDDRG